MDCGQEISRGFVVTRGDRAELLEFAEEIPDQMPRLIKLLVIRARLLAVAFGWNNRFFSCGS